jgi:hypothetical protein
MKDSETCLAEYIYDRIIAGNYKLKYRSSFEVILYFKDSWWWEGEKVVVTLLWFKFREMCISTPLARTAFDRINTRQDEIQNQGRNLKLATIIKELGLDCGDKK